MTDPAHDHHDENIARLGWDPDDPHGAQHHGEAKPKWGADVHHGHYIVKWQLQLGILALLLFFTALTVGVAQTEVFIMDAWDIEIPKWVNIVGAMSIATVKAVLVCAFFMQLRYDKALNTYAILFSLLGVGLFLTFTMIDLGGRGFNEEFKQGPVVAGGTGVGLSLARDGGPIGTSVSPEINTAGVSLAEHVYQVGIDKKGGPYEFWSYYYEKNYVKKGKEPHRHPRDETDTLERMGLAHHDAGSSANQTVRATGMTHGLFGEDDHHHEGHTDDGHDSGPTEPDHDAEGADHSDDTGGDHADSPASDEQPAG
ncbi:MAG: cytochrome C oxidase subunit IV family protein [Planctomycetota bacterium]